MTTKFTPGPWKVSQYDHSPNRTSMTMVRHSRGNIADVDGADKQEAEANANLIAAAPEMYEALKACHLQMLQSNNTSEYAQQANEMAIAALAKAEGREQ